MICPGGWCIKIDGQDFLLTGMVAPFLDVAYAHDYAGATQIDPLSASGTDIGTALGAPTPGSFNTALLKDIADTCIGPLLPLATVLATLKPSVTGLGINTGSGLYQFGFVCDVSGLHLTPYGVPLLAFGLTITYAELPKPAQSAGRVVTKSVTTRGARRR